MRQEKIKPVFEADGIAVFNNDNADVMCGMKERPQMIFADPPYLLSGKGTTCRGGKRVSVSKGEWDRPGVDLITFNSNWLGGCFSVLSKSGSIWVSGTHHNIFAVGTVLDYLKAKVLNVVTWQKPNPPPNLGRRTLTHSTEFVIWALPPDPVGRYTFNYARLREINYGKQMKDVWTIPTAPARERIHGSHPTQKPVLLLEYCILASTKDGDLVFDPFGGSGTTAIACMRLKRRCIITDSNVGYAQIATRRIQHEIENPGSLYSERGI